MSVYACLQSNAGLPLYTETASFIRTRPSMPAPRRQPGQRAPDQEPPRAGQRGCCSGRGGCCAPRHTRRTSVPATAAAMTMAEPSGVRGRMGFEQPLLPAATLPRSRAASRCGGLVAALPLLLPLAYPKTRQQGQARHTAGTAAASRIAAVCGAVGAAAAARPPRGAMGTPAGAPPPSLRRRRALAGLRSRRRRDG